MTNYLAELAAFGAQPSLGERIAHRRDLDADARKKNLMSDEMQQEMAGKNTLREIYGQYVGGDQGALQRIASIDPATHMKLVKTQSEQQAEQRKLEDDQKSRFGRMAIWANDEQKWAATPWGQKGVPFDQREQVLGQYVGYGDTLKTMQDQQNTQTGFDIQRRGQDLTLRGQDITLRGQNLTDARAREQNKISAGVNTFKDANTLRDEFTKQSGDFVKVRDAYGRIISSTEKPSAAGDLSLIFNYMKLLDPGSTVREGEFATAQQATGVPGRVINLYNNILRGERLSDQQRADFLGQSRGLYGAQEKSHMQLRGEYERLAGRRGIDSQDVIVDYRYQLPQSGTQGTQGEVTNVEASRQLNGKSYIKIGGQWYEQ